MATSPEALAQARNLLRKMDQSIDQARNRRLTGDPVPPPPPASATAAAAASASTYGNGQQSHPQVSQAELSSTQPINSNRAKPLPPKINGTSAFQNPPRALSA